MYSNRLAAPLLTSLTLVTVAFFAAAHAVGQPAAAPAVEAQPPAAPPREQPDAPPPAAQPSESPQAGEQATPKPAGEEPSPSAEADSPPQEVTRPPVPWGAEIEAVSQKKSPENLADLRLIQKQVRSVVEFARPATVGVEVGGAIGSAVIISEDGLALTAGHVAMEPNQRVTFLFADGRRARGVTLGVNSSVDSGMLKITDKGPWPFVPMAPAGSTEPGDWVVGLGQPNGYFRDRAPPVRLGRVLFEEDSTLCTDVTLVGGDSGGPLLNLRGQVVGIHSRIGRRIVSNYHVPIDEYHATWDRLAGGQMWGGSLGTAEPARHRAFLGVAGNSIRGGCLITQVYDGFAASRAGIHEGDVITALDGEQVDDFEELGRLINAQKPAATVVIAVQRDGKPLDFKVRLGIISVDYPGTPELESDS
ncbi:putative periplasmic serine endoprotease DegP-like precursor [Posidoniimonas polymericola]|uniref:Putative periplasmic serine endoprotease DegP-like n=1 Tax=Posidoniimonas polymericola TaxID=2528002 RepID=A0A5C5YHC3_9BACT|nr:trypsin-like peptidase domain-containing protein [Posidoniimonas polymericola]TWT72702.1 putative periplasmic serine endoprotease DegP-like precursor [Posidoniimonas polymericola]